MYTEPTIYTGSLKNIDLMNLEYEHPTDDIPFKVSMDDTIPYLNQHVRCTNAYVGAQIRSPYTYISRLEIANCFSDDVAIWTGDVSIGTLVVRDVHPYVYSDRNHKDIVQIYNFDRRTFKKRYTPVKNVMINRLELGIGCDDKHIIHCTEVCGYTDFRLFQGGVEIEQVLPGNRGYLISSTNAVNWVIGSPEHPIDPLLTGDRAIRIDGRKPGSKPSSNILLHARPGQRLELDASAKAAMTVIEYPY